MVLVTKGFRMVEVIDFSHSWRGFADDIGHRYTLFVYFIASSKTSTIPGISIAGASLEQTLYTPTLDVEYLVLGKPKSVDVIPITPEGIPTPAIITRSVLSLTKASHLVVDCGAFRRPAMPVTALPHAVVGGRIDVENALPEGYGEKLFRDGEILGRALASKNSLLIAGESMPGGTTTAMAIMEALGFNAIGRVSSASPSNPTKLKEDVLRKALTRYGREIPVKNVFEAVEVFGDPLHISIAGFVSGAIEKDSKVILAGGTQMCSVVAILKRLGLNLSGRVAIGTTKWIVSDRSSDIAGLVKDIAPEVPIAYTLLSFDDAPFAGLRYYERGYVKEGVGAGGAVVTAQLVWGLPLATVKEAIYREYERIAGLGYVKKS